jgi:5'(3')-deoxyribonucleotidase
MMKNDKIIGFDCDDVILDLMPNWLSKYNRQFNDILTKEQITDWDVAKFALPEARKEFYQYIEEPDVFWTAKPIEGALNGVLELRRLGFRIIIVSANNPFSIKQQWLKYHGFLEDNKEFIQAYDKSLIKVDYLVDDKIDNVMNTLGYGILFSAPWNRIYNYNPRVSNWKEVVAVIKKRENLNA